MMYPKILPTAEPESWRKKDRAFLNGVIDAAARFPAPLKDRMTNHKAASFELRSRPVTFEIDPLHNADQIEELWARVQAVRRAAIKCSKEKRHEASWSDQVVLKILELSVSWAGLEDDVELANV